MTGDGLPVLAAAPMASAREVSRGEGSTPSTLKPTTTTGGVLSTGTPCDAVFFIGLQLDQRGGLLPMGGTVKTLLRPATDGRDSTIQ